MELDYDFEAKVTVVGKGIGIIIPKRTQIQYNIERGDRVLVKIISVKKNVDYKTNNIKG